MEGDAHLWIENRFRIPAHLYGFNPDESKHGVNPARSPVVQLNPCTGQARGLAAAIQSRICRGRVFGKPGLLLCLRALERIQAGGGQNRKAKTVRAEL